MSFIYSSWKFTDDQFELEDRCVLQCPANYQIVDSETGGQKCEECDGICPQGILIICIKQ